MAFAWLIDLIGIIGAALTTLCWLPQLVKVLREKETRALSRRRPARLPSALSSG
jgi:MtN3 and saliva related transmembrane protein